MTQGRRYTEPGKLRDPETGEWNRKEVLHYARGWAAVAVALAVFFGGVWYGGSKAWDAWQAFRTQDDYVGPGLEDVEVKIPRGSTMRGIGDLLVQADVIKSTDTFVGVAQARPDDAAQVQAGTYKMRTQISAQDAFARLIDASYLVRNMIQFREGQRLSEQVALMSEITGIPADQFNDVLTNRAGELGLPDWAQGRPEGFLFPDTYELPDEPDALAVIRLATTHFSTVATDLDFVTKAEASPAGDAYAALIMASIVERESSIQDDRYKVARVFYNRLASTDPTMRKLQSDATVAYANGITGRVWTNDQEREIDNPYNTYKHEGLPPGPITSPSRAAMEAALNPAEGPWMYFVPVNLNTGETEFNVTYEEHQASLNKLLAWCADSSQDTENKC